jgi:dihydroxyacetone kinase-like protein
MIAASKLMKGKTEVPWTEVPALVDAAKQAMMTRGKASLGDKTVLDALDAASRAASGESEPAAMRQAAARAVDSALEEFRDKPNKIGRARVYADKTIGLDDPGMVAIKVMVKGLG